MAKTVRERARKHRAKGRRSAEKRRTELIAAIRRYEMRCLRKKEIAHLMERRASIAAALAEGEIGDIAAKSRARRAHTLEEMFWGGEDSKAMTVEERQELDLDTLKFEIMTLQARAIEKLSAASSGGIKASGDAAAKADLAGGPPRSVTLPSHAACSAQGASAFSASSTASAAGSDIETANSAGQLEVLGTNPTPNKTVESM